jgi:hypothetical protein
MLLQGRPAPGITVLTGTSHFNTNTGAIANAVIQGDLIISAAGQQANNTLPTLDGNFTNIGTSTRTTVCCVRVGSRLILTNGETTSYGTWTNASRLHGIHIRPSHPSYVLAVTGFLAGNATSTTVTTPALVTPAASSLGVCGSQLTTDVNYTSGEVHSVVSNKFGSQRTAMWQAPCTGSAFATQAIVISVSSGSASWALEVTIT